MPAARRWRPRGRWWCGRVVVRARGGRAHQLELDLLPVDLHGAIFLSVARASTPRSERAPQRGEERGAAHKVHADGREKVLLVLGILRSHAGGVGAAATAGRAPGAQGGGRQRTAKRSSRHDFPTPESPMSSILKRKSLRAPEPRSERSGGQSAEAARRAAAAALAGETSEGRSRASDAHYSKYSIASPLSSPSRAASARKPAQRRFGAEPPHLLPTEHTRLPRVMQPSSRDLHEPANK